MHTVEERAAAYVATMPPSIAGSGGHQAAFNVAQVLARGFALDDAAGLPIMQKWNSSCQPPWTDADLLHKFRSARETGQMPMGCKLDGDTRPPAKTPVPRRKAKTLQLPPMARPTDAELQEIADRRNLPMEAVHLVERSGFLRCGEHQWNRCFFVGEGSFVQARRFDGGKLYTASGKVKTINLPGSMGAFIGQKWLGEEGNVLLLEGAISLLEGAAAVLLADPKASWTVLAATSAASRFRRCPELLARLKNRRVRILPDPDKAGLDAAASWLADLADGGATADAVALPEPHKDVGDLLASRPSQDQLRTLLFR